MIWIFLILLIVSMDFIARFYLLIKDIKQVNNEFEEISENIDCNRRLTYFSGNKTLEKLLITLNKYLQKAQREKIKYIRREKSIRNEIENISHDLRTPLTSMLGYLELLENESISDSERKEYLSIIQRRTKGLYNLVQTFYDVSRLEAGEYKLNIEKINIDKAIREYLLLFYNDFEKNNINAVVELLDEEVYVEGDINALERIFANLFQNVIKYTKKEFKISLNKENRKVIIILSNYTNDLNKEELDCLFDRFYMRDNSRSTSSTGLGLTITKLLVEEMNGEIKAELKDNILSFIITFDINK